MRRRDAGRSPWIAGLLVAAVGLSACACGDDRRPSPTRTAVTETRTADVLLRMPYLGVSCAKPNSIACDRVGLAVWLRRPAEGVVATINGQRLELAPGGLGGRAPTYWEGFLQPAGLLDGALVVVPDRGRHFWEGRHPRDAEVRVTIRRRGGAADAASLRVPLRPGWG